MGIPEEDSREAEQDPSNPDTKTAQFGIFCPTHSAMGHCVHQCHIAIHANQNKEVDGAVGVYLNAQVDDFAHEQTKRPIETVGYVDSPERQTRHQDEVGSSQVAQVDLSHSAGLLVKPENHQDKHIEHGSQHSNEQDIHWLTSVEPLPVVQIRTNRSISVVLLWDTVENIKQRQ
uniref:Uncharacterized protein n=1 Tax=Cyclopterus lumpus TaxID=8103 RepID=A0A8C3AUR9_CYCLU